MLGVVTGLAAEARIARPLGTAMAGGGDALGAGRAAEQLIAQGSTALLSFGLAGGLDPTLKAGACIVPRRVIAAHGTWEADLMLTADLGGPSVDALYAGTVIAVTVADKRALWQSTGAAAIDLESAAVAEAAANYGLPFAVLRAVCDPADLELPPAALLPLDVDGRVSWRGILVSIMRHPGQLPSLIALAGCAAAARKTLLASAYRSRGSGGGGALPPSLP